MKCCMECTLVSINVENVFIIAHFKMYIGFCFCFPSYVHVRARAMHIATYVVFVYSVNMCVCVHMYLSGGYLRTQGI